MAKTLPLRLPSLTFLITTHHFLLPILRPLHSALRRRRLTTAVSSSTQTSPNTDISGAALDSKSGVITPRSQEFNVWYLDVIANAELADNGPVRGTMAIRRMVMPSGKPFRFDEDLSDGFCNWAKWEYLNVKFKETGHSNAYFPQFIPHSFIEKEASHVEGFSPELALVTIGGGKELEEKLVVRLTSETIVNHMFTQWIHSYRDLPLMVNQALQMIDLYTRFAYEQAAIPVIAGRKSKVETFAGASKTYTIEAMMGDKKALQAGTSHNLGQNFSCAFETLAVIVPIWKKADEKAGVLAAAFAVNEALKSAGIKVKLDDSDQRTPGWKFNF
ncbi:Proline--tRNA ligase, chloroplastic/mitochondrial-like protein [Drosera capensis]